MRVIVDNGAYTLRNMGDVAMLQVTLRRLRALHPDAVCHVLTRAPELLGRYCPGTLPLSVEARDAVHLGPDSEAREGLWMGLKRWIKPAEARRREAVSTFLSAFAEADSIVVSGGGFLNDLNERASLGALRMLVSAAGRKKVALFGQGLGPMRNPALLECLAAILRSGAWLSLRERTDGPAILAGLPVPAERIAVTGDDALDIETLAGSGTGCVAEGIGVSLRQIEYSGIRDAHLARVAQAVGRTRAVFQAPVIPLPVSFNSFENDPEAIARVTGQRDMPEDTPEAVISSAARCRVALTGTYHAAVFALAQGVPCVCFYASEYYRSKLAGLAGQFADGRALVNLDDEDAAERIGREGERLWEQSRALRGRLIEAARCQVDAARGFYHKALTTT